MLRPRTVVLALALLPGAASATSLASGRLPLAFVPNVGQTDARVRYVARGLGAAIYVASDEIVFDLLANPLHPDRRGETSPRAAGTVLRLRLPGADPGARIVGLGPTSARVNYLLGTEPARWHRDLPTYREIVYRNVWPGIDLRFGTKDGSLEYRFVVRPGARFEDIRFAYAGADATWIDARGDLSVRTAHGTLTNGHPFTYQRVHGRRVVVGSRFLERGGAEGEVTYGFALAGNVDRRRSFIIDPGLTYSTYLGGTGLDSAFAVAVDGGGHAYVTGFTQSADFPATAGAYATTPPGGNDVFVAELDPTGTSLVYATYLGGSGDESGTDVAIDATGDVYVTGYTDSTDFPTTPGAVATTYNGGQFDAFVAKLGPTGGSLLFSTYLGGSGGDSGLGIALDGAGSAYVTGETRSANFPTTLAAFDALYNGGVSDGFVTKLDPTGTTLVYSTYLGGSTFSGTGDLAGAIAVDALGEAVVTGVTESVDFPTTPGSFDPSFNGAVDAFVTKLDPTGSTLVYSTFLGGTGSDSGGGVAVDAAGAAYLTGSSCSADFPVTAGAYDTSIGGSCDAFVAKLDAAGSGLVFATYIGGSVSTSVPAIDTGDDIAVDVTGAAYVTGQTECTDFPTTPGAFDSTGNGQDAFVAKLDPSGASLLYATYIGGNGFEGGTGVAVDAVAAYVVGVTTAADFPTTPGALDTSIGGLQDGFVVRLPIGPCGNAIVDAGEQCDEGASNGTSGSCCTASCAFRMGGEVCRPAAGVCDVAESCTGTGGACPADAFEAGTVQCRPAAGTCDVGENCTGTSAACPQDAVKPATAVCRPAADVCDQAESCDGTSVSCPANAFQPSTVQCRAAAGTCDVAESCTGTSATCPQDAVKPATAECRAAAGVCDQAESCDGTSVNCPADAFKPSTVQCRAAAGTCDVAESCTGTSASCPPDGFAAAGTPCSDGDACTVGETCSGGTCGGGTLDLDACEDDFLCYKVTSTTPFAAVVGVSLTDDFESATVEVRKPKHLCTPANKNAEGVLDQATHLESYQTKQTTPPHVRQTNLLVTNQLGQLRVDTVKPDLLLVPTAKNLTTPPPPPNPTSHDVDHHKCYKIRTTAGTPRFVPTQVTVTDQFTVPAKRFDVLTPRHLCTPVDKNGEGIKEARAYLLCYRVKPARGEPKHAKRSGVMTNNQLGPGTVTTVKEMELCIPAAVVTP